MSDLIFDRGLGESAERVLHEGSSRRAGVSTGSQVLSDRTGEHVSIAHHDESTRWYGCFLISSVGNVILIGTDSKDCLPDTQAGRQSLDGRRKKD